MSDKNSRTRELLEHAVDGVAPPAGGLPVEAVFHRAAQLRRRRRGLVAGAATAAAAVLAFTATELPGTGLRTQAASPPIQASQPEKTTAKATPRGRGSDAEAIVRRILPGGVTAFKVRSLVNESPDQGDLDGVYRIVRGGRTGTLQFVWGLTVDPSLACEPAVGQLSCSTSRAGTGHLRAEKMAHATFDGYGNSTARAYAALLATGNVRVLFVTETAGFPADDGSTPPTALPLLTMAELTALALRPELKAGANLKPQ
ncbi:hypothetical protein [Actinacidiphila paucisporea]|uniref:Uncharacterized protein n=1 Tax=Actinacidiphila paucisporea TaxID=310782 RepID=A0A1M6TR06_9ACTN|nr:hypothetical protein [Actinacidiphila paucisporea]SHK59384.1 hypothetical protein SAMN05216499_101125 [Actinacidiphila paucisporea]